MTCAWTALAPQERIDHLQGQEERLVLDVFDADVALGLGQLLLARARAQGAPVLIDIRRGDFVLFRAALHGTTPDQQSWAGRKAAVVIRMEASSALVAERMSRSGVDPAAIGWLGHEYAVTGGSFPIRVAGVGVVAAVTASGLSSQEDHDLVVDALEQWQSVR